MKRLIISILLFNNIVALAGTFKIDRIEDFPVVEIQKKACIKFDLTTAIKNKKPISIITAKCLDKYGENFESNDYILQSIPKTVNPTQTHDNFSAFIQKYFKIQLNDGNYAPPKVKCLRSEDELHFDKNAITSNCEVDYEAYEAKAKALKKIGKEIKYCEDSLEVITPLAAKLPSSLDKYKSYQYFVDRVNVSLVQYCEYNIFEGRIPLHIEKPDIEVKKLDDKSIYLRTGPVTMTVNMKELK